MRVIVAGGGTGGHLFPGVAIAEEIKARDAGAEVLFVGTARGIEARVCPKLGWPLELIDASGLKTVGALGALRGLARVPRALAQSRTLLRKFRPDAVLGVGGYASGPVVLAAKLAGIPTAILEPNSVPGLANKLVARFVTHVFLAFDEARPYFPAKKTTLSGTPIRADLRDKLLAASAAQAKPTPHLFCFGGSLGARAVNALFADAVADLRARGVRFTVTHQTGKEDLDATRARYAAHGIHDIDLEPFIDDMATEYARADLVVARAGATTVAELTAVGRPAILVPYPTAADDHQTVNARALAQAGAALVYKQSELDAKILANTLARLLADADARRAMQSAMKSLSRPAAARDIVDWLQAQRR
jgi:UDP-N-acetylglucosamine--N-acetylmuramyl-(pentapeptide) pyrophosphoryl-undecaprenol N-acetylglucosamine transferase